VPSRKRRRGTRGQQAGMLGSIEPQVYKCELTTENALNWFDIKMYEQSLLRQAGPQRLPYLEYAKCTWILTPQFCAQAVVTAYLNGGSQPPISFHHAMGAMLVDDNGKHTQADEDLLAVFTPKTFGGWCEHYILVGGLTAQEVGGALYEGPGSEQTPLGGTLVGPTLSFGIFEAGVIADMAGNIGPETGMTNVSTCAAYLELGVRWKTTTAQEVKDIVLERVFEHGI